MNTVQLPFYGSAFRYYDNPSALQSPKKGEFQTSDNDEQSTKTAKFLSTQSLLR
jgi:hypothetical protein